MSDSLWSHGLQHIRLSCPSLSPRFVQIHVHWVVMPSNHLILCFPLFLLFPSFPASESFPMSQFFTLLLLLLLSRFTCVWPCATHRWEPVPEILQARTLEWAATSFSNAWKQKVKVKSFSHIQLSYPVDCSLSGPSIHGTFQARALERGAIAFSVFTVWYVAKEQANW